ncbi:hypothetical protein CDAR_188571 [Caerostris darwini]|uniref:Uncharacterized protein n=1 Tax=Caerostris darwini TaxID=1538125 RepID=A0AAV4V6Q3_9ARAC|nr:hypothetical protein CDAR_188441 [Caerostris darwini]GIY65786.1 hypothetical protein CDAR_188571 [Caerostris darwini]
MKPRAAENKDFSFNSSLKTPGCKQMIGKEMRAIFNPWGRLGSVSAALGLSFVSARAVRWVCLHKIVLVRESVNGKALSFLRKDIKEMVSEAVICVNGFSFIQVRHQVMLQLFCGAKRQDISGIV